MSTSLSRERQTGLGMRSVRPGTARNTAIFALAILIVLAVLPTFLNAQSYLLHLLFTIFVFATLGHAWNLMAGYAGLLTFGQQVFIGLGGFAQALVHYYTPASIWAAWPVAGIVSLAFAWLLAMPVSEGVSKRRVWIGVAVAVILWVLYEIWISLQPSVDVFGSVYVRRVAILLLIFLGALPLLRLKGAYFAVATWLVAEAVASIFSGWNVSGAGGGMQLKSDVTQLQLYYVALGLLVVTTAVIWRWMRSRYGLALTAVRDDEDAARSSGVDVSRMRAAVFLFSGAVTGLASGLHFMDVVIITPPSAFTISWATYIVFVAVAGGMGTVAGPLIGAVIFVLIDRVLGAAAGQGLLVLGILSILLMLILPRGVMGVIADLRQPKTRRRRSAAAPRWRVWLFGDDANSAREGLTDRPGVVGAYLVPGSALLALDSGREPHADLVKGMAAVAQEIQDLEPDALIIYSTQWFAVLDQLWQGRPRLSGVHVDENWHELGEWRYVVTTDVPLAKACVRAAQRAGIASKLVDYDAFPLDSGTLCAQSLLNPEGDVPSVIVANNLYLNFEGTRDLGDLAATQAATQGKRVVVLAVGGLSGHTFRDDRPLDEDAIATPLDDEWNRRILKLLEAQDAETVLRQVPEFSAQAHVDMGFKHLAFALGALGGQLGNVQVLGYGPQYGAGAAVVRLS
ncbi:MAG: hypothetical protein R3E87_20235 [Burkholderiaceae bacterium]